MKFWILYNSAHYELDLDLLDTIEILKSKLSLMLPVKIPPNNQILKDPQTGWVLKDDKQLSYYYACGRYTGSPPYIIEIEQKSAKDDQIYVNSSNLSMCYVAAKDKEIDEDRYLNLMKEYQQVLEDKDSLELRNKELEKRLDQERASKTLELEVIQQENCKLQKEIDLLNETLEALPKRLEADIGVEDSRVEELELQITNLQEQMFSQKRKFQAERQILNEIITGKNDEIKNLTNKLEEAIANILSLSNIVKKQEVESTKVKNFCEESLKEYEEKLKRMKEYQDKLVNQTNALKTKWRTEARRNFHDSMSYIQRNYKQLLAVEELGFLKPCDSFTPLKSFLTSAESTISLMTSSSSYEQIDCYSSQDLSGLCLLDNVEDENQNTDSERLSVKSNRSPKFRIQARPDKIESRLETDESDLRPGPIRSTDTGLGSDLFLKHD